MIRFKYYNSSYDSSKYFCDTITVFFNAYTNTFFIYVDLNTETLTCYEMFLHVEIDSKSVYHYICYYSNCCEKITDQSNLRKL